MAKATWREWHDDRPTVEPATVFVWRNRRYLTKRSAYVTMVREAMRESTGHESISHRDWEETGERCYCEDCDDRLTQDMARQAAWWLMRIHRTDAARAATGGEG